MIAPVPLHGRRERERGYNQSSLLAREVSRRAGIGLAHALRRTRDTPTQTAMSIEERRRNVDGAFECAGDVRGQRALLVDDVVTTGATMSACAATLKAAGATKVWGLSFARQATFGDDGP